MAEKNGGGGGGLAPELVPFVQFPISNWVPTCNPRDDNSNCSWLYSSVARFGQDH